MALERACGRPLSPATLHVVAGWRCDNGCVFCSDGGGGRTRWKPPDPARVRAVLEANVALGQVEFTGREPSLTAGLADWIGLARQLGYRTISVVTNGRSVGRDPARLDAWLDAGLTRLRVSLQGPTATVHDAISRRPGSFAETTGALERIARCRRERSFGLSLHATLCALNLGELSALVALMARFEPDLIGLNALQPQGRALGRLASLLLPPGAVVGAVARVLEANPSAPVSLSELPLCTMLGRLPGRVVGLREDYRLTPRALHLPGSGPVAVQVRRDHLYGPPCEACLLRDSCEGVPRACVERWGWTPMRPVREQDLDALRFDRADHLERLCSSPDGRWRIERLDRSMEDACVAIVGRGGSVRLEVVLSPCDEARPAYRRTQGYNVLLAGTGHSRAQLSLADALVARIGAAQRELEDAAGPP